MDRAAPRPAGVRPCSVSSARQAMAFSLPPGPSASVHRTWPPLKRHRPLDPHAGSGEHRLRVAGPNGRQRAGSASTERACRRRRRDQRVDLQTVLSRRPSGLRRASRSFRKARRSGSSSGRTDRPAAMAWPPPASSSPSSNAAWTARPRFTPGWERPEPLPTLAARSTPIDDHRLAVALAQAAGDDADHARVPAVAGHQQRPGVGLEVASRSMRRTACVEDLLLDLLARGVEHVELGGQRGGLVGIVGGQQPRAEVGAADATAGVDPRPQDEAGVEDAGGARGPWRRPAAPSGPGCAQADITFSPWAVRARLKPTSWVTSQMAPSAARSSHWRRSGSAPVLEQAPAPRLAVEGGQQHEGHARRRPARPAPRPHPGPVGVDQGGGRRRISSRIRWWSMTTTSSPMSLAAGQRLVGGRAAVDGDDQVGALVLRICGRPRAEGRSPRSSGRGHRWAGPRP